MTPNSLLATIRLSSITTCALSLTPIPYMFPEIVQVVMVV